MDEIEIARLLAQARGLERSGQIRLLERLTGSELIVADLMMAARRAEAGHLEIAWPGTAPVCARCGPLGPANGALIAYAYHPVAFDQRHTHWAPPIPSL